jgi:transcriptional regulator with XRE-family HTH domain
MREFLPDRAMKVELVLGSNVRRLRRAMELSQEELAALVGIDMRYLGGIERGQENPSLQVIANLAKALQVTSSSLLESGERSFKR